MARLERGALRVEGGEVVVDAEGAVDGGEVGLGVVGVPIRGAQGPSRCGHYAAVQPTAVHPPRRRGWRRSDCRCVDGLQPAACRPRSSPHDPLPQRIARCDTPAEAALRVVGALLRRGPLLVQRRRAGATTTAGERTWSCTWRYGDAVDDTMACRRCVGPMTEIYAAPERCAARSRRCRRRRRLPPTARLLLMAGATAERVANGRRARVPAMPRRPPGCSAPPQPPRRLHARRPHDHRVRSGRAYRAAAATARRWWRTFGGAQRAWLRPQIDPVPPLDVSEDFV